MADVTGPISSLPGSAHTLPAGMTCDNHPDRPAVKRIQGETDSFGCEMWDVCRACADKMKAYRENDRAGCCDWCNTMAIDLRNRRDADEGSTGRIYQVCGACVKKDNEEYARELEGYDYDDGGWL